MSPSIKYGYRGHKSYVNSGGLAVSLLLISSLFFNVIFAATTYTWDGTSNNWNTPHWTKTGTTTSNTYPQTSSDIVIISSGTVTISSGSYTINQLTVNNTASTQGNLTIISGATLTVSGTGTTTTPAVSVAGGNINNGGTLTISTSATGAGFGIIFNNATNTTVTTSYSGAGTLNINTSVGNSGSGGVLFNNTSSIASSANYPTILFNGTTNFTLATGAVAISVAAGNTNGVIGGTGFTLGSSGSGVTYGLINQAGGGSSLTINSGTTLTCYANSSTLNVVQVSTSSVNATLTNNGNINIYGTCKTAVYLTNASTGACYFTNGGTVTANTANASAYYATMYIYASAANSNFTVTNSGTISLTNTSSGTGIGYGFFVPSTNAPSLSISNSGTLNYTGNQPFYGGTQSATTLTNTSAGVINTNYDIQKMTITNNGTISFLNNTNASSAAIGTSSALTNNGTINTNTGTSYLYSIPGVTNGTSGILAPGGTGYGIADVNTSGTVSLLGTLQIQVGGCTAAGTDYDQLKNVSGTFSISNLNLSITNTLFTPTTNYNPITIISSGGAAIIGTFASVSGLTNGWSLLYNSSSVQLVYNLSGYYVSPSGSDNNVGSINYPLQTISRAMNLVGTGDTVYLRAGTYRESVTIPSPSVTLTAYSNEQATISGTDVYNNLTWTSTTINGVSVYSTPFSGNNNFEQLFFNGKPMVQARWPNLKTDATGNWNFWDSTRWADAGNGSVYGTVVDASPNSLASAGFNSVVGAWAVLNVSHQYYTWTRAVTSHSGNTFTYASSGTSDSLYSAPNSGRPYNDNRYYLVGMLQFLDSPGEWFNDTINHLLYFYPPNGLNPNTLGIEIKNRNYSLSASGQTNLTIQNLTLFGTAFNFLNGCNNLTFKNNTVNYSSWTEFYNINSGRYGYGNESNYPNLFGNQCTVSGNTFSYGALSSLLILGNYNLIENNIFHDFDFNTSLVTPLLQISRNWNNYVGVAGSATVRYNDIYNSGGVVMQLGQDSNSVYYNHIYNGFMSCYGGNIDVAMVYTSPAAPNNTSTEGTHIYKNWIHNGYAGSVHIAWGGGIGIRGDDSTAGLMLDHNVTWQIGGTGIEIKNSFSPVASQANYAYNNTYYSTFSYITSPYYMYSIILDATSGSNENKLSLIKNNAGKGIYGGWYGATYPYTSNVTNNYTSNALLPLIDSTNYDFRPTSGSALIDAGVTISNITGFVSGSAPDEGAYELGDTTYFIPGFRSSTTSFPIVPNGATGVSFSRDQLMWRPAYQSVSNKVYFGTSSANLTLQTTTSAERNVFTLPTLSAGATYYWRVDAVMSNGSVVTGTLWSFTTGGSCTSGTYIGSNGSNANDASNWCGGVPTGTTNVIISTNAPQLTANLTVNNLTLNSGITLNGYGLTVNGTITGSGLITGSPTSNLSFNSSAKGTIYLDQTTQGTTNALNNLTIATASSDTIYLGNTLRLIGTVIPTSGVLNTGPANLKLVSSGTGTARIDQVLGDITGTVAVWRYIPAKTARRFSFIGSPISQNIGGAWQKQIYITGTGTGGTPCGNTTGNGGTTDTYNSNGFDVTQNNTPSMFTYNASKVNGSRYVSIPNTTTTNLTPGIGYSINIRGNRNSATVTCANQLETTSPTAPEPVTLTSSGTLITGAKSVSLYDTSVSKFNLIANPYPSQISFTAFQAGNSTKIYNKMWTYSPYGNGNFTTYSAGVIANGATGYDNTIGDYIASGQAFFVEATQAGSAGSVTFQEAHKTSGTVPNTQYFGSAVNKIMRVGFRTLSNDTLDEVVARFNSYGSKVYDAVWDAESMNNSNQILTINKGEKDLAIATFSDEAVSDTVQLSLRSSSIGSFRLLFSDIDGLDSTINYTLFDNFLGKSQNIRTNPSYDFNVTSDTASKGKNRFFITVTNPASLPFKLVNFYATALTAVNKLGWQTGLEVNNKSFEVQRKKGNGDWATIGFVAAKGMASTYAFEDSAPSTLSYYRLKEIDKNGEQSFSKVVCIQRNEPFDIKVSPNPTKDWIHFSLPTNKGSLQTSVIRLYSPSGYELLAKSTTDSNLKINLGSYPKGVYFVEVEINGSTYRNKIVFQ